MGARESLQKLADKKQQEIEDLEAELERAKIYLQAILDSMKVLPREQNSNGNSGAQPTLRPGTGLAKAREAILAAGRPLHISELLLALGKPADKQTRVSLSGSIAWYVRKNQVFTRPSPNTFGLIEMGDKNQVSPSGEVSPDLPDTFGG
jgi:hypothetical protein